MSIPKQPPDMRAKSTRQVCPKLSGPDEKHAAGSFDCTSACRMRKEKFLHKVVA